MVGTKNKKVTLSLNASLVQDVRRLVREGAAKSQSAFFEAALRERVKEAKHDKRRRALRAASKDPQFLADIEEVERDFAHADAEAARTIR